MLLAKDALLLSPANLLGFLGDTGDHLLHLVYCFSHKQIITAGWLCIKFSVDLSVVQSQEDGLLY